MKNRKAEKLSCFFVFVCWRLTNHLSIHDIIQIKDNKVDYTLRKEVFVMDDNATIGWANKC